ncbi:MULTISPECIES: quinone oxidoreductase family protein [Auritidibacter]|uniref:quinone oxidoreductase family protein n=1 Tax=Auritidibacter TaxID=1160973 RepID=UPI000D736270|nr:MULTISPECIES: quinone oxidoreductase [Auritidibacter]AXR73750.1 quinone oxidoreductase [Auritidibacter sp. NML130574]NIH72356.1 NADPH2:quinone reductase [Auritidibacter ignavus]PXA78819.1 NADPH:quinone reductase [Auritidibacter sp. NML120636]RMX21930.1 quinone oxidoreductase [Auritidibacter ignavus]WGH82400.1 quinone oxidoreductase [Auritidibacter ignavus]
MEHFEIPTTHHAAIVSDAGGVENFSWSETSVPAPGPEEVLITTAAVGLNFIETYQRSGVYSVDYPFIPGTEGAGTVVALGEDVTDVALGQRVATAAGRGTYAEHFVAPASQLLPVPDAMDLVTAAALPLQGLTAHYLARSTFPVAPGDAVLIHAGAGGVGLLLTQLCVHWGATVYTTASTDAKRQLSRQAGAEHCFDYENFAEEIAEVTGGRGVDVVYDGVGASTFDGSLEALKVRGMMVLFGGASGQVPPFDLQRLNSAGGLYITRPALSHYTATAEETASRARELFDGLEQGWLTLRIDQTVPLSEVGGAHTALESRQTTGKTVLTV